MNIPAVAMITLIRWLIDELWAKQSPAVALRIYVLPLPAGQTITINGTKEGVLMITLRDDFVLPLAVAGTNKKGHPAPLENLRFSSSDDSVLTVGPDGLCTPGDNLGTVQITVKADPKIGPEEGELIGTVDVEVVAGEAVTLQITGTPKNPEP
jgi:hypothetical protein